MTAISGAFANLIGGVSQQPPEIRTVNSAEKLLNTWSDVATGLSTRPAAQFVSNVSARPSPGDTVADHTIQKPSGNYKVVIHGGNIFVCNMETGQNEPVTIQGAAASYIATQDAAKNLKFVTVGDTTFIYNTTKICTAAVVDEAGLTGLTEDGVQRLNPNRYGTFWVRQRAGYKSNYALYLNNVRKSLTVTDTLTPTEIASDTVTQASAAGVSLAKVAETVVSVTFANETDFVTSHDDLANEAIRSFNDFVDEFTDLPNFDRQGRLVLIKQSRNTKEDDYWVWYKNGAWEETYGWDAYEKPNNSTMPHVLVDNRDGTWTLKAHEWPGRTVGDADSNPSPTFIGRTINAMFLYKGRMIILTDENFLASQVGNYENFYRSSCTQLLDEDCIDISSPNSRGAKLLFGKEFDGKLVLSSSFDQFTVEGSNDGTLSPNTVSIKRVNTYNTSPDVDPVFVGPNFVFVDDFQNRGFALLREYQVERVFGRQVALPITDQVPEYIPSGVYKLAASASDDILVLLSKGNRKALWLYNYYYNNDGKVLSSWQEWEMPFDVYGGDFLDDILTLTVAFDTQLYIVSFKFEAGADRLLDNESVLLDLRVHSSSLTVTFDGTNTNVTIPYDLDTADLLAQSIAVISPVNEGSMAGGRILTPSGFSGGVVTFANVNLTGQEFLFGLKYRFFWQLNPIYVRDNNQVAIQDGRLQLRNVSFLYNNSGPFEVQVTPQGRETYRDKYANFLLGSSGSVLTRMELSSGEFRTAAYGQGDRVKICVEAWTPWRVRFSSLEWDGAYRGRYKRTT